MGLTGKASVQSEPLMLLELGPYMCLIFDEMGRM